MKSTCGRHGAQNAYDAASKQTLENEFGTHNEDECMIKILEGGTLQETEVGYECFEVTEKCSRGCRLASVKERRMRPWVHARPIRLWLVVAGGRAWLCAVWKYTSCRSNKSWVTSISIMGLRVVIQEKS